MLTPLRWRSQDHALGRLLQRAPTVEPGSAILDGHRHLLMLHQSVLSHGFANGGRFLLRAGPGGFVCSLHVAPDVSLGGAVGVHVQAHTWLHNDMLHDRQVILIGDGARGERLGDGWLLPPPLRRLDVEGDRASLITWAPGLPETLAATAGRA